MINVGVDIGMRRLAVGSPTRMWSKAIDLKNPGDRYVELNKLTDWLLDSLRADLGIGPDAVNLWIEASYVGNKVQNIHTALSLAETIGAIQGIAEWGRCEVIGQSTWKAQVCGHGNLDKQEVLEWLWYNHQDMFDLCEANQDRIDAMCIGIYGDLRMAGYIDPPVHKPKKRKKRATSDKAVPDSAT
jgi:hypothetical protein